MGSAKGAKLYAGTIELDITPPLGGPMAGFGARKAGSIGIHDKLFTRALAVEQKDSENALILISCDLIDPMSEVTRQVRSRITDATGIPSDNIAVMTTHTHGGPDLKHAFYRDWIPTLVETMTRCAVSAWEGREAAEVAGGAAHVDGVGINRRGSDIVDRETVVLAVRRAAGEIMAVVVNYACHPTVLGPDNRQITAGYPGYMARALRRELGPQVVPLFLQGAAGDINQGHSADLSALGAPIPNRTFERAEELGERLAKGVTSAVNGMEFTADPRVEMARHPWKAMYRTDLPSVEEAQRRAERATAKLQRLEAAGADVDESEVQNARIQEVYANLVLTSAKELAAEKHPYAAAHIQVGRIGSVGFTILPGELFVEIGLVIKERSPFDATMVVGYSNDGFDYIPTAKAFTEGGYEPTRALFRPETAEELTQKAADALAVLDAV